MQEPFDMLIGIEVSAAVTAPRTGVGYYVANMVSALRRIAEARGDVEFLYYSNRLPVEDDEPADVLTVEDIYPRDRFRSRFLWMQGFLPRSLAATRPDVCHFPNYLAPLMHGTDRPLVITVHDMAVYRCPWLQPLKTVAVHRAILPRLIRAGGLIATVSESSRQDIVHYFDVPKERIRVVYGGVSERFRPPSTVDKLLDATVFQSHGIRFPYVLSVGTLEPRKNHRRLVQAFSSLVRQQKLPHHLVLAGAAGWKDGELRHEIEGSVLRDRIHFLGYVPTDHLPSLYRGADAFAYPSIYEGFGLPVLEAMACGTPVLISTDSALMEVAGEGSTIVANPLSPDDIAAGLWSLLRGGAAVDVRRSNGIARAREFSWERSAVEMLRVYFEAAGEAVARPRVASRAASHTERSLGTQP
jgi:glycosyltransferase involved in cell wall biosynthesis